MDVMTREKLSICYIPGRESGYSRNRVLIRSMRQAGFKVYDCSHESRSILRYAIAFCKFARYNSKCDIVFVGFLGQFLVPIIKLLTKSPIVFDAFISVYQTMVSDRRKFKERGLLGKAAKFIDKFSCNLSDAVFLDTNQHIDYFVNELGVKRAKFVRLLIGSDDRVMFPRASASRDQKAFRVHFHGEFQELHGTDVIIKAARLSPDINFVLIGKGKRFLQSVAYARIEKIDNIEFVDAVPYEVLPEYIASADVCLGVFGTSQKATLVIPHKIYEAIACAKPVISAVSPAARELFTHKVNIFFCEPGDPNSLARAVKELKSDEKLRSALAENGYRTFVTQCSTLALADKMKKTIAACLD